MAEILTQSEIDELLQQVQQGQVEVQTEPQPGEKKLEKNFYVYDFRHPNRVTREQIRTLRVIHESFAKQAESYLSSRLRAIVSSKVEAIDQITYAEFQLSLSDPSCICVLGSDEFKTDLVVEISPPLAFLAIDRLFGGVGEPVTRFREMSLIEQNVIQRFVEGMLKYYDAAWKPVSKVKTLLKTIHSRPSFAQIVAPGESVVAISIGFSADEVEGSMNFCLPYLMLEDLLPNMSAGKVAFGSTVEKSPEQRAVLEKNLKKVSIPVNVTLGKARLTLRELLDLQAGDVLVLGTRVNEPVPIAIGGEVRARGKPGVFHGNVAVEVQEIEDQSE